MKLCGNKNCRKSGILQEDNCFHKNRSKADGLANWCKECNNLQNRKWAKANPEKVKEHDSHRKEYFAAHGKNRRQSFGDYEKFKDRLIKYDAIRKSKDGYLMVKCKHCKKYFTPTIGMINNRLTSINSDYRGGESHFYCSDECKNRCIVYNNKAIIGPAETQYRAVQPELKELVLERDEYQCIKCGSKENLNCHHIESVLTNPIESADVDNCITLCSKCHKEAHSSKGCSYTKLTCSGLAAAKYKKERK